VLKFTDVSLRRGTKELFKDVNLTINSKTKVGITGANGTGKTSLFKLILGELHADTGDFTVSKKLVMAHVAQEIAHSEESAIDFVMNGDVEFRILEKAISKAENNHDANKLATLYDDMQHIDGYTATARAAKLLNGLGFTPIQEGNPVNSFSGGWRMRLNLAKALMCRSDILLLDEPTNHLDLEAIIWLESWLKKYNGIVLLISHDRDFLNSVCNQIVNIEHAELTQYTGDYDSFEKIRAEKLSQQQSQFESQQRQVKHMQKYIDRFRYQATKAKQAQSRIKALERMEMIGAAQLDSPFNFTFSVEGFIPQQLIKIDKASVGYGDTMILNEIDFMVQKGDKIGLLGFNGAGKSTFIKLLAQELQAKAGEVNYAKELKIGYFAQHQIEQLHMDLSPIEHLKIQDPKISEQQARNYLGGFDFHNDMAQDTIAHFSGGEKARLVLALVVYEKPNLLLLDEPTNHLDIKMRHAISVALQSFEGAMILVSHDRHLLSTVTDKLLLVADSHVSTFDGDLTDYYHWANEVRRNRLKNTSDTSSDKTPNTKKQQRQDAAQVRQNQKPLRQELRNIEKQLTKLQNQEHKLDAILLDESIYNSENAEKLKQTTIQQTQVKKDIIALENRWLELSEQLE
jgi:ATP-binding cassette subfamily F protein 3